ncbi:putative glycosyltransferase [Gloeocapsa sp. PCC 73106]|nr:putative glycosyltransferase [Gloeocapsa sp. PCC 73106]
MLNFGVVTIGRNEGQRLINCLNSLRRNLPEATPIVYVDSGSVDKSCQKARELGVLVVELDTNTNFTAARARNAGFEKLLELYPDLDYVQFIDGDCELIEGWIEVAIATLANNSEVVAVCGWRKEKYPKMSIYNRICDMEWHMGNVGEIANFGGEVMIRASAFQKVGGYDNSVIAAEDDELAVRLRQTGGKLVRIDQDCSLHDANMHSLGQWWQRIKRSGYAYAQVAQMHGKRPERKFVGELQRLFFWGLIVPAIALGFAWATKGLSLLLLLRYPLSALMVTYKSRLKQFSLAESTAWGLACAFSPFPGLLGAIKYYLDRWRKREHKIIEYKNASV